MTASPHLVTRPSGPLQGTLSVPGDKSITHRAIILSALADGEAVIGDYCRGEDCLNTVSVLQALGIPIEVARKTLKISGKGLWGLREPDRILDCGNSGTGIRLLAGLLAVTEPALSRDHTERMFAFFGIPIVRQELTVTITGRTSLGAKDVRIPGDLSAAAFFLVAASIVPGSDVTVIGVGINPTRTGILDILHDMGAQIDVLNRREQAGEPVCDLRARASELHGITINAERVLKAIDEIPILSVAAASAKGDTTFTGAAELRVKESDRLATMACELGRMGVKVEERPDGLKIGGGLSLKGAVCQSYGDHRVAMSMAVAGLIAEGETQVHDSACVATSFPDFDKYLRRLLTPSGQG